ncbi:Uncharacterised protein [Staphylococcus piscifermentans]|nr:Uncharacterised protein [Staphylococcus piscifermentans]
MNVLGPSFMECGCQNKNRARGNMGIRKTDVQIID